jgi:hypothetical protein
MGVCLVAVGREMSDWSAWYPYARLLHTYARYYTAVEKEEVAEKDRCFWCRRDKRMWADLVEPVGWGQARRWARKGWWLSVSHAAGGDEWEQEEGCRWCAGGVAVAGRGRLVEGGGGGGEYWVVGRSVAGTARQADGQTATERQAQTGSRQARAVV